MVIGSRSNEFPGEIPLATRLGREIPNFQDPDVDPLMAERTKAMIRKKYALVATERRSLTGLYNCHGCCFANRRTAIHDPTHISLILEDDGYHRIRLSEVEPGDLVLYYDGDVVEHTVFVLEITAGEPESSGLRALRVLSKWGSAGEFLHRANEGPYSGLTLTYWTDRP